MIYIFYFSVNVYLLFLYWLEQIVLLLILLKTRVNDSFTLLHGFN